MLTSLEDKPMMDEFVALYLGVTGGRSLEQKFREQLGRGQDEGAYHLNKSGDMWQYGIRNLQVFFKNNEAPLGYVG